MRIFRGELGGRRIDPPSAKWPVRPTTDFAREALFNILDNRIDYELISFLDLFGGTGIHSLEFASRGCKDITYVDKYKPAAAFMKEMNQKFELEIRIFCQDVLSFVKAAPRKWDYIFADPPYDMKNLRDFPELVLNSKILTPNGFFVLEHSRSHGFSELPDFLEARTYGQSVFSFFTARS